MPTNACYQVGFWQADPRKWEKCRQAAAAQMLAEGWNKHARKFSEVQRKRAMKLWHTN